jgi:hypothetical protein
MSGISSRASHLNCDGIGPKFLKLYGRVLYRQADIDAYEESCLATSTKAIPAATTT